MSPWCRGASVEQLARARTRRRTSRRERASAARAPQMNFRASDRTRCCVLSFPCASSRRLRSRLPALQNSQLAGGHLRPASRPASPSTTHSEEPRQVKPPNVCVHGASPWSSGKKRGGALWLAVSVRAPRHSASRSTACSPLLSHARPSFVTCRASTRACEARGEALPRLQSHRRARDYDGRRQ